MGSTSLLISTKKDQEKIDNLFYKIDYEKASENLNLYGEVIIKKDFETPKRVYKKGEKLVYLRTDYQFARKVNDLMQELGVKNNMFLNQFSIVDLSLREYGSWLEEMKHVDDIYIGELFDFYPIDYFKGNLKQVDIVEQSKGQETDISKKLDVSDKLVINLSELIKKIQESNNLTNEEILKKLDETKKEIQNEIGVRAKVHQVEGIVLEVEPVELEKNIAYNFKVAKANTKGGYTKGVIFGSKSGGGEPTFNEGDFVKLEGNFKHQKYNEKDYFTFVNVKTLEVKANERSVDNSVVKDTLREV